MESSLVIFLLCFILFGLLQVSYMVMANDVISLATWQTARSATVGMGDPFLNRVARMVSLPTAGPSSMDEFGQEDRDKLRELRNRGDVWDTAVAEPMMSSQQWQERFLIPYYLGERNDAQLPDILNYYNWMGEDTLVTAAVAERDRAQLMVTVRQGIPLEYPMVRAFYRGAKGIMYRQDGEYTVPIYVIEKTIKIENHANLYMTAF